MRVRVNSLYVYDPVPLDLIHRCAHAKKGDTVRVINLRGAPKANTMGQCHIQSVDGEFLGMVSTNSLQPKNGAK
jgi:hypothetical protein